MKGWLCAEEADMPEDGALSGATAYSSALFTESGWFLRHSEPFPMKD
jgi:hypothetical protein